MRHLQRISKRSLQAKKVVPLLICILLFTNCLRETKTQYAIDADRVYLVVTPNTTREELTQIASELKAKKNIDLDYAGSKFLENGKISEVMLAVDCNDGFKGSTQCSASALRRQNIGFLRDYQTEADLVFHIGAMKGTGGSPHR